MKFSQRRRRGQIERGKAPGALVGGVCMSGRRYKARNKLIFIFLPMAFSTHVGGASDRDTPGQAADDRSQCGPGSARGAPGARSRPGGCAIGIFEAPPFGAGAAGGVGFPFSSAQGPGTPGGATGGRGSGCARAEFCVQRTMLLHF